MAYINRKDRQLLFDLITAKVQTLLSKNNDGDNDYMILRLIEVAENLGLDTNLIIDKNEYFAIAKKYKLSINDIIYYRFYSRFCVSCYISC